MKNDDTLVWLDTETFGLDPATDPIIEVGFLVTDIDLGEIDYYEVQIWDEWHEKRYGQIVVGGPDDWVMETHTTNGLFADAQKKGMTFEAATDTLKAFLDEYAGSGKDPMCGNSVQFDRMMLTAQLPVLASMFHYRNIDISSVKELCRRLNPELYGKLKDYTQPVEDHRVRPDLEDSLAEAGYYFENFLFVTA